MGQGKGGPPPADFGAAARTATSTPFASQSFTQGPSPSVATRHVNSDPLSGHGVDQWQDASNQWHDGAAPQGPWEQHVGFNGPLAGAASGLQQQFADANKNPLDNGAGARQHAEDAIYSREASRLDPMWNNREQANRTQLEQQGIDPNSEAGRTSMDTLGRSRNDAYSGALQQAIMGGGQEAQRQQGMDLQSRLAPLMGMQGMQGLLQQPQNQMLPAAIAQYQGELQKYGIDQQGKNSTMGGLSGLGGTLGAAAMA